MKVSIIVAADENGTIGDETGIPWHLPADLKRFRKLTMGKPILMGRTTHEHIGRPLPGRTNIVLSRREGFDAPGCAVARELPSALGLAEATGAEEAMIIGGGALYREALPLAETVYLTKVAGRFPGTVRFPIEALDAPGWVVEHSETVPADEANPIPTEFMILRRQRG
jgi:dihydrofolate reductase